MTDFLDAALSYAKRGWAVFPLAPGTKVPLAGSNGLKDATTDLDQIVRWWTKNPRCNIGMATGQKSGGVLVMDLDRNHTPGVDGYETLIGFLHEKGTTLGDTVGTITPNGGYHWFFRVRDRFQNTEGKDEVPGIDFRGDGGYVILPPSKIAATKNNTGGEYCWEFDLDDYEIADAPPEIIELHAASISKTEGQSFSLPEAIPEGGRNGTLFKLACSLRAKGLSDAAILAAIKVENDERCKPPLEDRELNAIVNSASRYDIGGLSTDNKSIRNIANLRMVPSGRKDADGNPIWVPEKSADNVATVLREDPELAGRIRFDVFANRPRYTDRLPWRAAEDRFGEWSDADDAHLRARLQTVYDLKGKEIISDGLAIVLFENRFNPVIDVLEGLPPWGGHDYIADLLPDFLGAERNDYNTAAMKLFMLEALTRIYQPGSKADYVLVLVGPQGIGKSRFFELLAINAAWFDGNFNTLNGKEAAERLSGKWICELAELLAMKRAQEVEAVKAFISNSVDSFRDSYGHYRTDHPRYCVFGATTNEESFLSDRTGNRRFLPVRCNVTDAKRSLFAADTEDFFLKAWAQALHVFKAANKRPVLVLPSAIRRIAEEEQAAHLLEDPRVGVIQEYLDRSVSDRVCVIELWQKALREEGAPKKSISAQLHSIMRNDIKGWEPAGQQRFSEYGQQRAYRRTIRLIEGFEEDDSGVPF